MRGRVWIRNPGEDHTVLDHPEATIKAAFGSTIWQP